MFKLFQWPGESTRSKTASVKRSEGSAPPISRSASLDARVFDPIRWELANPWLVEGQPDDRMPVNGAVAVGGGTPAERRSFARRSHQLMFKKWSQDRRE